ncbi:MAG: hypothetical protein WDN75_08135 [Bacteroidota bacterium]
MLKIYEDEDMIANAAAMGKYIAERVERMKDRHPSIGDFRDDRLTGMPGACKGPKDKRADGTVQCKAG